MTDADREQIRHSIEAKMRELEDTIAQLKDGAAPVDLDQPIGRLSRMDSLANQAISDRMLAESRVRLERLKRALVRLDHEDFGLCEECDEPIATKRLLAMPEATLCIHCAE